MGGEGLDFKEGLKGKGNKRGEEREWRCHG